MRKVQEGSATLDSAPDVGRREAQEPGPSAAVGIAVVKVQEGSAIILQ